MSDEDEAEEPLPKPTRGASKVGDSQPKPFAHRALCVIAGVVTVLFALPTVAAALDGFLRLAELPHAPAWAYGLMGLLLAGAIGLVALGAQIMRKRVWAAAVIGLIYGYLTLLNFTKERLIGGVATSLIVVLCLAVVIAAWRLRRADRVPPGDEAR